MTKIEIINYILEVLKITIPAVASVSVVMLGRYFEKQKEIELRIREKKITIYEKFVMDTLNFLLKSQQYSKSKQEKLQNDLVKTFEEFHKNILFWGSDSIIKSYNNYRFKLGSADAKMEDFEDLIFAFRKDVGHKNKNLCKYDVLKMLLKVEEFDEKGKPKQSTLINNNPDLEMINKEGK